YQLVAKAQDLLQAHVDSDCLASIEQGIPILDSVPAFAMCRYELHGLCVLTVRQRDAAVGGTCDGSRDAGHHLKRDAMLGQMLQFFAAPAKNKAIAAFQAHDGLA